MTHEALSGGKSFGRHNSPPQAEQSNLRESYNFPQSTREFLHLLRTELVYSGVDLMGLYWDSVRGCWERTRSVRELEREKVEPTDKGLPIAILPGFLSMKWWYDPEVEYFERRGHRVTIMTSPLGINFLPIEKKEDQYMREIYGLAEEEGEKVQLHCDSQGVLAAAALAVDYGRDFESCVAGVSNTGGVKPRHVNIAVGVAYLWSQYFNLSDDFQLARKLEQLEEIEAEGKVRIRSIYNPADPILPRGIPIGEYFPTPGSHVGAAVKLSHLQMKETWLESNNQTQRVAA